MLIEKTYYVDYAHRLAKHEGLCRNLHGHTGKVVVRFMGSLNLNTGMIADFGDFNWLKDIVNVFDHTLVLAKDDIFLKSLEESYGFALVVMSGPPTAENIARFLADEINKQLQQLRVGSFDLNLHSISFTETPGNTITYTLMKG